MIHFEDLTSNERSIPLTLFLETLALSPHHHPAGEQVLLGYLLKEHRH